jgi:hypothetical protein
MIYLFLSASSSSKKKNVSSFFAPVIVHLYDMVLSHFSKMKQFLCIYLTLHLTKENESKRFE